MIPNMNCNRTNNLSKLSISINFQITTKGSIGRAHVRASIQSLTGASQSCSWHALRAAETRLWARAHWPLCSTTCGRALWRGYLFPEETIIFKLWRAHFSLWLKCATGCGSSPPQTERLHT